MSNQKQTEKIYNYSFRLLGLKPYTEFEIRNKIKGRFKKIQAEDLDEVLNKLKELKYVDDEKFAKDYIYFRVQVSPRGKFLLKQELYKKGIADEFIQKAINESEIDEVALAKELFEHKSKALQNYDQQKRKEKMMRFLQSRGFGYDVIKEVLA